MDSVQYRERRQSGSLAPSSGEATSVAENGLLGLKSRGIDLVLQVSVGFVIHYPSLVWQAVNNMLDAVSKHARRAVLPARDMKANTATGPW